MKQAIQKHTLYNFTYMTFTVLAEENQGSPGRWWPGQLGRMPGNLLGWRNCATYSMLAMWAVRLVQIITLYTYNLHELTNKEILFENKEMMSLFKKI